MMFLPPFYKYRGRPTQMVPVLAACCAMMISACTETTRRQEAQHPQSILISDTRQSISLPSASAKEHRAVMLQHLESVQAIINALAEEKYELAKGLTESHLGFFRHREMMARQEPANFPPAYHDLAMAHHEAAEQLAGIIPTKDLKQIMTKLNDVLKACVACHHEYTVRQVSSHSQEG